MIQEEPLTPDEQDSTQRYYRAMHAVQMAVKVELELLGPQASGADAKHLRTGINSAMVNDLGVTNLLLAKGVFTRAEYLEAIAQAAELEQAEMTTRVRQKTGMPNLNFG